MSCFGFGLGFECVAISFKQSVMASFNLLFCKVWRNGDDIATATKEQPVIRLCACTSEVFNSTKQL